jgi:DNA-directed RNA polymerase subunit beta'
VVTNSSGQSVVLNRNGEVCLHDARDREIDRYAIPTGAEMLVKDGRP